MGFKRSSNNSINTNAEALLLWLPGVFVTMVLCLANWNAQAQAFRVDLPFVRGVIAESPTNTTAPTNFATFNALGIEVVTVWQIVTDPSLGFGQTADTPQGNDTRVYLDFEYTDGSVFTIPAIINFRDGNTEAVGFTVEADLNGDYPNTGSAYVVPDGTRPVYLLQLSTSVLEYQEGGVPLVNSNDASTQALNALNTYFNVVSEGSVDPLSDPNSGSGGETEGAAPAAVLEFDIDTISATSGSSVEMASTSPPANDASGSCSGRVSGRAAASVTSNQCNIGQVNSDAISNIIRGDITGTANGSVLIERNTISLRSDGNNGLNSIETDGSGVPASAAGSTAVTSLQYNSGQINAQSSLNVVGIEAGGTGTTDKTLRVWGNVISAESNGNVVNNVILGDIAVNLDGVTVFGGSNSPNDAVSPTVVLAVGTHAVTSMQLNHGRISSIASTNDVGIIAASDAGVLQTSQNAISVIGQGNNGRNRILRGIAPNENGMAIASYQLNTASVEAQAVRNRVHITLDAAQAELRSAEVISNSISAVAVGNQINGNAIRNEGQKD